VAPSDPDEPSQRGSRMKLEELETLTGVKEVVEIEHSYADYGIIIDSFAKDNVRVFWLRNLRDDLEWRGDHIDEVNDEGFIQFREKNE
jgi:hypothetical protein